MNLRKENKKYDSNEFPLFMRNEWEESYNELITYLNENNNECPPIESDNEPLEKYLKYCVNIINNENTNKAILITGSLQNDLKDNVISSLIKKLNEDKNFSVIIYIGKLYKKQENICFKYLKEQKENLNLGNRLRVVEIGIKTTLHGIFSNKQSIFQYLHTEQDTIRKSYKLENVDLYDFIENIHLSHYDEIMKRNKYAKSIHRFSP